MSFQVHPADTENPEAISSLYQAALEDPREKDLVRLLLQDEASLAGGSFVARAGGRVIGHILGMQAEVRGERDRTPVFLIGALAVEPGKRNQGVGGGLLREALRRAKFLGYRTAVALGPAAFYSAFDFVPSIRLGIQPPFEIFGAACMACRLQGTETQATDGRLILPAPFNRFAGGSA